MSILTSFTRTNFWRRFVYTLWAPGYDRPLRLLLKKRRRSIELADLTAGERVLLVGAGTGLDLELMVHGLRLTAIDLTPAMLAILRRRAGRLGIQVDARVMDAQAMDFPDDSFDVAILHLILSVVPDPVRCVREVARVLRPGGRAMIFDKLIDDKMKPSRAFRVINPLLSLLGTEIIRQLGPLLQGSGLVVTHEETTGAGGIIKIVMLRKVEQNANSL